MTASKQSLTDKFKILHKQQQKMEKFAKLRGDLRPSCEIYLHSEKASNEKEGKKSKIVT